MICCLFFSFHCVLVFFFFLSSFACFCNFFVYTFYLISPLVFFLFPFGFFKGYWFYPWRVSFLHKLVHLIRRCCQFEYLNNLFTFSVFTVNFSNLVSFGMVMCLLSVVFFPNNSCLNFWDKAWWFLSLRVFGLLSSSLLLFPQRFSWYVLRPSSGVCRTREPSQNFELRPLLNPLGSPDLIPLAITGYKC